MVVTSAFALGAGFLGGMLGLGGGTIISPLLIEMGMHPQVKIKNKIPSKSSSKEREREREREKREPHLMSSKKAYHYLYLWRGLHENLVHENFMKTWCMTHKKPFGAF